MKDTTSSGPTDQNTREIWPDMLRIISVIAVIVLHAGGAGFFFFKARSFEWQVCNFYDGLVRFGVPCFVMLSGMFILNPEKEYPLKKLFLQKIVRIVTAFFFWSACYYIHHLFPGGNWRLFLREFPQGYYHMWFLGMICGLYIISPFLRLIVKNEKLTRYFLILAAVFVFMSNVLNLLPESAFGNWLIMIINSMDMKFVAGYSGYFVWGYWLATHKLSAKARKIIYISGIIGAVITIAGNGILGYWLNELGTWTYDSLLPNVAITATAVFVFCQYNFKAENFSATAQKIVGALGKWSFGIYLAHVFFLEHLYYIGLPNFFCNPLLSVPITVSVVFFASLTLVFILNQIPGLKKYVI